MKHFYLAGLLSIVCLFAQAQFSNGGFHSNFGIDADTRAGYKKYGPAVNITSGDDWFAAVGSTGRGVIDTSNAAYYKSLLQSNMNVTFSQKMSAPLFNQTNGKLWLDAGYVRDYTSGIMIDSTKGMDSTAFGTSTKNGENPNSWDMHPESLPGKTDIIDAYMHLRRDGLNITDPLWLFAGMSTRKTDGDRYLDMELYKKQFSYNPATKKFNSAGLSLGHTEWLFDPFGNIIQTGDLIITVTYPGGGVPVIELRIWVNRTTHRLSNPKKFNFGRFDGNLFGYATITPEVAGTSFGSAIGNVSNSSSKDTTLATPWGTLSDAAAWSSNYESLQLIEVGINLTNVGIDPALYTMLGSPCNTMFNCIMFKSRSSHSFTANLQDFAGPIYFDPVSASALPNVTLKNDTLTCDLTEATIAVTNNTSVGVYTWYTPNGEIARTNSDNSVIKVKKSGYYTLGVGLASGCPIARTETVFVPEDRYAPVVTADITLTESGEIQLLGGDENASNYMTPFGPSKGLIWEWKGPNGFTSNEQNPLINVDWAWGAYYLTVTEKRNGCKASASMDISFRTQKNNDQEMLNTPSKGTYLSRNLANQLHLISNQEAAGAGSVMIHNINGQLLSSKNVQLVKGQNTIQLPTLSTNQVKIISFYVGKQLMFTKKVF